MALPRRPCKEHARALVDLTAALVQASAISAISGESGEGALSSVIALFSGSSADLSGLHEYIRASLDRGVLRPCQLTYLALLPNVDERIVTYLTARAAAAEQMAAQQCPMLTTDLDALIVNRIMVNGQSAADLKLPRLVFAAMRGPLVLALPEMQPYIDRMVAWCWTTRLLQPAEV